MAGTVNITQRGRVLLVTLENPPLALMDEGHLEGLIAALERAESDPDIGGVVLTGAHPTRFIAHYDVGELLQIATSSPALSRRMAHGALRATGAVRRVPGGDGLLQRGPAAGLAYLERFHETLVGIQSCPAVWIAALNGSALGGGCEVALACDRRFMAAGDHLIGQPEIMLGFPPGGGGTQRLARLLGPSKALRVVLDGKPFSPTEAAELGIVDEVVDGDVVEAAIAEAERLGARPKAAIGSVKRAVYIGGSLPLEEGLRLERAELLSAMGTDEAKQAMAAYVEATKEAGELPAYDRDQMDAAFARGRFA
jgi:enoyl-CoA hydratase